MKVDRRAVTIGLVLLALGVAGGVLRLYVDGEFPAAVPRDGPAEFSYGPLAQALAHVEGRGRVDFDGLKADRAPLDAFVASLAKFSPATTPDAFPTEHDKIAYWVNAYNALVLQALVDRWPSLRAPDDLWLGRFYWGLSWPVGGKRLTLKAIVDRELREGFGDPRVFFALHCGAMGCAELDSTPYQGDILEGQFLDAARRFMADKQNVRIEGKVVHLSQLFRWYQKDFVSALPEGRTSILQFVWAFLPDTCEERPGCDTRSDLDKACGPGLDQCTYAFDEWSRAVRARGTP